MRCCIFACGILCDIRPTLEAHPARLCGADAVQSDRQPRCVPTALCTPVARRLTAETARPCGHALGRGARHRKARSGGRHGYRPLCQSEFSTVCGTRNQVRLRCSIVRAKPLPSFPCTWSAPRRRSDSHGLLEPQSRFYPVRAVLRRISAVAAARAEPIPSRATKAYSIARKSLVAAVLYDATEPGLKQSREAGTRHDGNFRRVPLDLANGVVRCHR